MGSLKSHGVDEPDAVSVQHIALAIAGNFFDVARMWITSTNVMEAPRCSRSSTVPSSAATYSTTGIRNSSASSMPLRRGAGSKGHPRHHRQLRNPQVPEGAPVAPPASSRTLSLHPTSESWLGAVEGFFGAIEVRRHRIGHRPAACHQSLRCRRHRKNAKRSTLGYRVADGGDGR
jgi:hypothetical protein